MKTESNVIFRDHYRINEGERAFQDGQKPLQNIVDAFNALGINSLQDFSELKKLMHIRNYGQELGKQLEAFVEQKMSDQVNDDQVPKLGFFRMKKQSFVAMLEKPDLSNFVDTYSENYQYAAAAVPLATMEKGKVQLCKIKHAALIKSHTVEAETPGEKAVLKKLHSIIETLEDLTKIGAIATNDLQRLRQATFLAPTTELQVSPVLFTEIKNRISNN